jgi:hypothetical protein
MGMQRTRRTWVPDLFLGGDMSGSKANPDECVIDKSAWGPGPWQDEPDRWEGEAGGFPLLATRGPGGHWCGYVAVPPGHPWHGKDYNDVPMEAHGGLTYADACQGKICHIPKPGESDDVWWFGFDCAHLGDYAPKFDLDRRRYGVSRPHDTYRTLAYVQQQCRQMAEQAKAAS